MAVQLDTSPHIVKDLLEAVQLQHIFEDGKTFPDCLPKRALADIEQDYHQQKDIANFDLKKFVLENFSVPVTSAAAYKSDPEKSTTQHI